MTSIHVGDVINESGVGGGYCKRITSIHIGGEVNESVVEDQRIHERLMGVDANSYNVHYSVLRQRPAN
ncbi:1590_t:CDS:2 [Paraglomus occultum]|uniref:1590_t:CDS:1 n=1 Tax=Paraglomus occultum TaxID=144539 RepID=A0A9N9GYW7_9GLOM|nr:1590_t:CDS:2 [Paraglomus occultum]